MNTTAAIIAALVIAAAILILEVARLIYDLRAKRSAGITVRDLDAASRDILRETDAQLKIANSMLVGAINAQSANINALAERVDKLVTAVGDKLDVLRDELSKRISDMNVAVARGAGETKEALAAGLAKVNQDNAAQLEKMRQTVDEKLSSTLETRFNQSFKIVNDRLEEINRTFGELQNLQSGVNDLTRVFNNVKTRGTWGEVSLENLLSQILAPEQYAKQVQITRGSAEAVDFVLKMPGKGDGEVLLPIDAKFPLEDYARLVEASEKSDADKVEAAVKALTARVKQEAMSIRDKYVRPPKTTDFAIMYLPTEGLFAEVIRRSGVIEEIQTKYRVVICGPTTIAALLNSLQMGFRSVAVEKRSAEIGKLLASFVSDFDKFADLLRQTGDKLGKVQSTISSAEQRTDIIRKKLGKVGGSFGNLDGDEQLKIASDDTTDSE